VTHVGVCYSHPDWLVRRWLDRFGSDETEALCQANNAPAPLTIRANVRWIDREPLAQHLADAGVTTSPCRLAPAGLVVEGGLDWERSPFYQQGLFTVQSEASMLAALALAPAPEWRVADLCSGVGGKTTHLAELMDDRGSILACDYYSWKIEALIANCRRLELRSVQTLVCDARELPESADFDACLLDAPCSGTGVLARRPDSRWRRTPDQLAALVPLQRELLEAGWRLLRPGGVLLYATCSIEPEENADLIARFLADHAEATEDDLRAVLPFLAADAFTPAGAVQLLPHRHGTDGMFITRLRRAAAAA
jgi:16S rRNA (cytosine967-C5)-methyltransferase